MLLESASQNIQGRPEKVIEKDFKEVWGESLNVIKYAAGHICQKNRTVLTVKDEIVYQTICAVRRDWHWVPKTRDDKRNHCSWAYCVIDRETQACRRRTEEEEKIKKEMLKIFFKDQEGSVEEVKKLQKSRWLGEISNEEYVEKSEQSLGTAEAVIGINSISSL